MTDSTEGTPNGEDLSKLVPADVRARVKALRDKQRTEEAGKTNGQHAPASTMQAEPGKFHVIPGGMIGGRIGRRVLNPNDPCTVARTFIADEHTVAGHRTIHRHRGGFYLWREGRYIAAKPEDIGAQAWEFMRTSYRTRPAKKDDDGKPGEAEIAPLQPKRRDIDELLAALVAAAYLDSELEAPAWLDGSQHTPAAEILPVANGLLHLPTGELLPASPLYFGMHGSTVAYDPGAPLPTQWLRFLEEIFSDEAGVVDGEAIAALQEWFGYVLLPDTSLQKMLMLIGPRRCGKGTIARVLAGIIGKAGMAAPTLSSLATNFGLQPLIGKTLAVISDARLGGRTDQAQVAEQLLRISGEDAVTADRKNQMAWTGTFPTRFMLLTNELPRITDASSALARRFILLTMTQSWLGKEDAKLTDRLLTEAPGILNWAREGYLRLRECRRFTEPASSAEAVEDMEMLGSPERAFVRDRCTVAAGKEIDVGHLFTDWVQWCDENGKQHTGTPSVFSRNLKAAFPAITTKQIRPEGGGDRYRAFVGIGRAKT